MKVYTRTGDDGTTGLFGGGRVRKDDPRIAAYGTVDELNAVVGVARSAIHTDDVPDGLTVLDAMLALVQHELFVVGADLATPAGARPVVTRITGIHAERVEHRIDALSEGLPELRHFILPGGGRIAALLHVCRTVCRRAERAVVSMDVEASAVLIYLNRLSDFFFVAARAASVATGHHDTIWEPTAGSPGAEETETA